MTLLARKAHIKVDDEPAASRTAQTPRNGRKISHMLLAMENFS